MANPVTCDQVIDVATRLFAELSYDGTPFQLIADAVGVSSAQLTEMTGGKRELYLSVMQRFFEAEQAMLQESMATAEPGPAAVHRLADAYLDFYLGHPNMRALWTHRWVSDAADIADFEDRFSRPLMEQAATEIRNVVPPDVDTYYLLGTLVWCVHGFMGSGLMAPKSGMIPADDPGAARSFRAYLHLLMDRLLMEPAGR
ncbi:TetR/AcrR family transcriptional regulator [Actinomadura rudentiformis]|uniref:TetR/AcrR family transcriptional regulator n=1 Tax=Actinomadura rudentiformis TaxID=359158 RepID=A0A6H9Z886_9ACTN|nr:TetR/AcrR family transcriptional regulator [Actinomadura rudentiformis]KAB2352546.1 TetR/AcrR family transcriptional regulator [Actinomadura rudentiformis]